MNAGHIIADVTRRQIRGDGAPLLSIFIPGRNDGFMENFNYRIETTINYMARNLSLLGLLDEVELIVVDWGSEIPLHNVLKLSPQSQLITRYIIVPPAIAVPAQRDSEFPIVIAQNVALRRSKGLFLMQTDSDVMFSVDFFNSLFSMFEIGSTPFGPVDKVFFSSQRKHIPWAAIAQSPSIESLEKFIGQNSSEFLCDDGGEFGYCATGMMVMHRDLWMEVSGYDERLIHWGWMEIDLGMRVTRKYPWCDVTRNYGMMLYHMEHYKEKKRVTTRKCNPMNHHNAFRPNPDNWGLGDIDLPEFSYRDTPVMLLM